MASEYEIGRDVERIQQRLERVEGSVSSLDEKLNFGQFKRIAQERPQEYGAVAYRKSKEDQPTEESTKAADVKIIWSAKEEASSRRILAPDNSTLITYFAFLLDGVQFEPGWGGKYDSKIVQDAIKSRRWKDFNNDRSLIEGHYYRPTGYRSKVLVAGWMDGRHYSFCLVDYSHASSNFCGRRPFSWYYDMDGIYMGYTCGFQTIDFTGHPQGWVTKFTFGDADFEYGVGFSLGFDRSFALPE